MSWPGRRTGSFGTNEADRGWDAAPVRTEIGVLRDFAAALGQTLRVAGASGRKLYGFAEHQVESTFLGTSAGVRLRHDQPTGRVELNAKSADLARSAWTGVATRDFTDVDIAALDAGLARAARLGQAHRGAARRAVRDAAPADRRVGPAHVHVLVGRGEGRGGRPDGVQQGRRRHPGRRAAVRPARDAVQRPAGGGPALRAVRDRARVRSRLLGVRQRAAARPAPTWVRDGSLSALVSCRHSAARGRAAGHARPSTT